MSTATPKPLTAPVEGWGWPLLSRKVHYFVEARSLCAAWGYTGRLTPAGAKSPDDCKGREKRLATRQKVRK